MNFAESDHCRAMRQYEQQCQPSTPQDEREPAWKRKEDELVNGGLEAIATYEATTDQQVQAARSIAEYGAIGIRREIAERARQRLENSTEGEHQ